MGNDAGGSSVFADHLLGVWDLVGGVDLGDWVGMAGVVNDRLTASELSYWIPAEITSDGASAGFVEGVE